MVTAQKEADRIENSAVTGTSRIGEPLITRVMAAPRELVFEAWTNPDKVTQWSPDGFVIPAETVTIDLRLGGRYEYCMVQTEDGAEFWLRYLIVGLIEPELLVLESQPMPELGRPEPFTTTIQLDIEGDGTRMALYRPYPAERRASAQAGWNSSFDKIEALLHGSV